MQEKKNLTIIETNTILRYFLRDNEELYFKSEKFFNEVFSWKLKSFVLQAIIAEVIYVYKII